MTLAIPTVHLNGTSRQSLIDDIVAAREALRAAVAAMSAVTPNGRDYYPQGPGALNEALAQHRRRVQAIDLIHDELGHIAETLSDEGDRAA